MSLAPLVGAAVLVAASVYFAPKIVAFFKKQAASVKPDLPATVAQLKADVAKKL